MLVGHFLGLGFDFCCFSMKKRKRLRKNKDGYFNPRRVLEDGCYLQLSFEEKVFTALTWLGFTNAEAWGVINPLSEASANSRAVMAGRYACNYHIKRYIEALNRLQSDMKLTFKGFKGYNNPDYDD